MQQGIVGVLVHLFSTGTGKGLLAGDDEVWLAEVTDDFRGVELMPGQLAPRGHLDHLDGGTTVGVEVVKCTLAAFLYHVQTFGLCAVLVVGLHLKHDRLAVNALDGSLCNLR